MIVVDPNSPVPPYEQVRAQLAARVLDGTLAAGTRLPTVRRLAEDLGLAVNTVARAYRELEAAGVVETHGRGGTVVSAGTDQAVRELQEQAQRYATRARELGVDPQRAVALVRAAIDTGRPG